MINVNSDKTINKMRDKDSKVLHEKSSNLLKNSNFSVISSVLQSNLQTDFQVNECNLDQAIKEIRKPAPIRFNLGKFIEKINYKLQAAALVPLSPDEVNTLFDGCIKNNRRTLTR